MVSFLAMALHFKHFTDIHMCHTGDADYVGRWITLEFYLACAELQSYPDYWIPYFSQCLSENSGIVPK